MSTSNAAMRITGADFLGGFISDSAETSANSLTISLKEIYRPPQHRKFFNPEEIEKLKTAISENGFRGVVLVSPLPEAHPERANGFKYELVYGGSRCRAMEELGELTIPAEVKNLSPREVRQIRLDENLIRADLNPLEEAEGLLEVMADEASITPAEVERELNAFSNATKRNTDVTCDVARHLEAYQTILNRYKKGTLSSFRTRLIKFRSLPDDISEAIAEGEIDASKALELGSIKDRTIRGDLLAWVMSDNPSVQRIREEKRKLLERHEQESKGKRQSMKTRVMKSFSRLAESGILEKPTPDAKEKLDEIERLIAELLQS